MKMQKPMLSTLYVASIICSVLMVLWLILLVGYLILTGATYSYQIQNEDGSIGIICNIPIFTTDNWLWLSFELFGVPIIVLIAAIQTIRVLQRRFV
jgi:hypothetical protein